MLHLFVSGLNYKTAPVEVRERLTTTTKEVVPLLTDPEATRGLAGVMILSTCNRVEIYGIAADVSAASQAFLRRLCRAHAVEYASVEPFLYEKHGIDALRHCFRVASGLDSMIVGEPQILGQFKDAFALAQRHSTIGLSLQRIITRAFAVAKKVRTKTRLGERAVSVPCAAVDLARKIFGDLRGVSVLLIGAGEMGTLAARQLAAEGARLAVANRTWSKALAVARELSARPLPFESCSSAITAVDIVITSTGAQQLIVSRDAVLRALLDRGARPLFFIDIAVPRNVEANVGALPRVFCYDIDDLERVVDANLRERRREAQKAEALLAREVETFARELQGLAAVPAIVSVRKKIEAIRQSEVAKALARLHDDSPETRAAIEAMSSSLVNKILHTPTVKLREVFEKGAGDAWGAAFAELFALEVGPNSGPATDSLALAAEPDHPMALVAASAY